VLKSILLDSVCQYCCVQEWLHWQSDWCAGIWAFGLFLLQDRSDADVGRARALEASA